MFLLPLCVGVLIGLYIVAFFTVFAVYRAVQSDWSKLAVIGFVCLSLWIVAYFINAYITYGPEIFKL
jgi:hypothetical protein